MRTPRRIQRKRTSGWQMPAEARYVGRPSKWGNPFRAVNTGHGQCQLVDDRGTVYDTVPAERANQALRDLYELHTGTFGSYEIEGDALDELRRELGGRDLACWCPLEDRDGNPVACHADVLLQLANDTAASSDVVAGG